MELDFLRGLKKIETELGDKPLLDNKRLITDELSRLLTDIISKIEGKIGIAFSGGVDSSLIALFCSKLNKRFMLYSVGLENSKDVKQAIEIASKMKWPLKYKILDLNEAEQVIKEVIKLVPLDTVNVGVGSVVYSILEMAKEDKFDLVLNGLGSEELFAGYERHRLRLKDNKVHEECWNGLKSLWGRDLIRETNIARHFDIKVEYPFLNLDLVKFAMQIDPKLKIDEKTNKIILRETAFNLGLGEFAFRKKIAAQYGSGFDKALGKIAKQHGFKFKKDFLGHCKTF